MAKHVHIYLHDAKFTGEYSAQVGKTRKALTATVSGIDHYEATDKIRALFERKYGSDFSNPVVKWGASKLPASSQSLKIAKRAGPEEDD